MQEQAKIQQIPVKVYRTSSDPTSCSARPAQGRQGVAA